MKKQKNFAIILLIVAAAIIFALIFYYTQTGGSSTLNQNFSPAIQVEMPDPVIGTGITTDSETAGAGEHNE